jgi:DNA-directed RNA polymerase subunit RPC12/RpoP
MSCHFCKEHIEFPAHALGRKISCPHCNRSITLMERA